MEGAVTKRQRAGTAKSSRQHKNVSSNPAHLLAAFRLSISRREEIPPPQPRSTWRDHW